MYLPVQGLSCPFAVQHHEAVPAVSPMHNMLSGPASGYGAAAAVNAGAAAVHCTSWACLYVKNYAAYNNHRHGRYTGFRTVVACVKLEIEYCPASLLPYVV